MRNTLEIPLFPLDLVLLPNEVVPLHIFEDRYKKMVKECLKKNTNFGVVNKTDNEIASLGCVAKIEKVLNCYDDGSFDILIKGGQRFSVQEKFNKLGLWKAKVALIKDKKNNSNNKLLNNTRNKYLKVLMANKLMDNIENEIQKKHSFDFCQFINLNTPLKQSFIEMEDENERLVFLNSVFDRVLKVNKILSKSEKTSNVLN